MNFLVILIARVSYFFTKIKYNGSAFPGGLALKLNKNILKYFKMPKTIFVTGTTGKGSVVSTLKKIYTESGYTVTCNYKGSNLLNGVTTALILNSKLSGKIKTDVVILEIDERYIKEVSKYIVPDYFIINNLSRDQLARNGHFLIVFDEINKSIKEKTTLILNVDDPLVNRFSLNKKNKIINFGVKENKFSSKENLMNTLDQGYCPICHKKLEYSYFNYGNLGNYRCPKGDFIRQAPNFEANVLNRKFDVDDISINLPNKAIYNVYNLLASYALAITDNLEKEKVVKCLNTIKDSKRITDFNINGKKGEILLSKNETPLSYNQSIEYIKKNKGLKTVGIGFTRISGRYDLKDLSWLYDINFELLNDKNIENFILIGPFAYDVAVRLKLAGIDSKKFIYCLNYKETIDYILKYSNNYFYGMFYFDMDYFFIDEMEAYK